MTVCDKGKVYEDEESSVPRAYQKRFLGLAYGWRLEERLSLKRLDIQQFLKGSALRHGALLFNWAYPAICKLPRPLYEHDTAEIRPRLTPNQERVIR